MPDRDLLGWVLHDGTVLGQGRLLSHSRILILLGPGRLRDKCSTIGDRRGRIEVPVQGSCLQNKFDGQYGPRCHL